MAKPEFADRSQSRAIVIAALIGLAGTIVAALIGREVGERGAESDTSRLEVRLEQQEQALQSFEDQLASRDATIKELSTRLEQASRSSRRPKVLVDDSSGQGNGLGSSEATPPNIDVRLERELIVQRFPPFDIGLEACEHIGGVLACKLVVENTGTDPANLALKSDATFLYSEGGSEHRVRGASLGSRDWSADKFSAVRLEPRIPIAAKLNFPGVSSGAKTGSLKIVLGVVGGSNPAAIFLGDEPSWQSLVFRDVSLH